MEDKSAKNTIPERKEIKKEDKWNLDKLYKNDEEWEKDLKVFYSLIEEATSFKGKLSTSAEKLSECLEYSNKLGLLDERLGYYAHLKHTTNGGDDENQKQYAKYATASAKQQAETSFIVPEVTAIPEKTMETFLQHEKVKPFKISLDKLLRFKPHILSENEEKLLALQAEAKQTANKAFSALTDVDMEFGTVKTEEGDKPLSQSTFSTFLLSQDRNVRKEAYTKFYENFDKHKNTLAALYAGSVHQDLYSARVRKYPSCRAKSLFSDKVPEAVYDNLVKTIRENLGQLHRYYTFRRKSLKLEKLAHYDTYVPLISTVKVHNTYEKAAEKITTALSILGDEYCSTLHNGLMNGWVDRYENKGKRSGAFSAGSYVGDPYILMNYKEDVLRDVFTLAHEGGHSMHSYYSKLNNPFQHYNYTIFEAEVASTFNEQILADYLFNEAEKTSPTPEKAKEMKIYLLVKEIDDIIATIFRQTMFAEFELKTHRMAEEGIPLTLDSIRKVYRELLDTYFGQEMALEEVSCLEALRIPHFYRAFYVYKYATGLAAAIALSQKVMTGGEKEKNDYLSFLKSGGSHYPLESLKIAGVDMSSPEPIKAAIKRFSTLLDNLIELKPV